MKINIFLISIVICLISASYQTNLESKQLHDCANGEIVKLNNLVMDLYYNKINLVSFIKEFIRITSKSDSLKKCITNIRVKSSTVLSKIGLTLLYESNCLKDVGPAFLILDNLISNLENIKTEWKSALVSAFVFGVTSFQSYNDCKSTIESIIDIWTH